jgi:uncharacterized protein YndB with AHSA1/START domain
MQRTQQVLESEMNRKSREVGETKATGFQIGMRKTVPSSVESTWRLLTSPEGLEIWSGGGILQEWIPGTDIQFPNGTRGQVRVFKPGSHLRISWQPPGYPRPSLIQIRVLDRGERSVISFHQEHLPDSATREKRRMFFQQAMAELEKLLLA